MEQHLPLVAGPAQRRGRRAHEAAAARRARVVRVRGHYRLDGTYVRSHFRRLGPRPAAPDEAGPHRREG
jgi:hypothetical protein